MTSKRQRSLQWMERGVRPEIQQTRESLLNFTTEEYTHIVMREEKKRKLNIKEKKVFRDNARTIKNRISAKRSRDRKKIEWDMMCQENERLKKDNAILLTTSFAPDFVKNVMVELSSLEKSVREFREAQVDAVKESTERIGQAFLGAVTIVEMTNVLCKIDGVLVSMNSRIEKMEQSIDTVATVLKNMDNNTPNSEDTLPSSPISSPSVATLSPPISLFETSQKPIEPLFDFLKCNDESNIISRCFIELPSSNEYDDA